MAFTSISSIVLSDEAEKLGLEVEVISEDKNLFYIKSKSKEVLFKSTDFGVSSSLGVKLSENKELSYLILKKKGIPLIDTLHLNVNEMRNLSNYNLTFPVIIKPIDGSHGNGVLMNILNIDELKTKLTTSFKKYNRMIIQKQVVGNEYRLLVLNGKVILTIHRIPAHIVGDGNKNISKLIELENKTNLLRGVGYTNALTNIVIDLELRDYISKQGIDLKYIPKLGQTIQLRGTSNIGTGGTMLDVSDIVSKDIQDLACESAKILGLGIAGVDIITTDITRPLIENGGIVLEINDTPGLGGDRELTSVNTAKVILEEVFK